MLKNVCQACGTEPVTYMASVSVYRRGSGRKAGRITSESLPLCAGCAKSDKSGHDLALLLHCVAQRADVRWRSQCASAG